MPPIRKYPVQTSTPAAGTGKSLLHKPNTALTTKLGQPPTRVGPAPTELVWKPGQFRIISAVDGAVEIARCGPSTISQVFGIYLAESVQWNLTHLPTGLAICSTLYSEADARQIAQALWNYKPVREHPDLRSPDKGKAADAFPDAVKEWIKYCREKQSFMPFLSKPEEEDNSSAADPQDDE